MDRSNDRPRRSRRLEVWLFVAMMVAGLLGFMGTLSSGDVVWAPAGDEPAVVTAGMAAGR
jgi:hypothetical protein